MLPVFLVSLLLIYLPVFNYYSEIALVWSISGVLALVLLHYFVCRVTDHLVYKAGRKSGSGTLCLRRERANKMMRINIVFFTFFLTNLLHWYRFTEAITQHTFFIPMLGDIVLLSPLLIMIGITMGFERKLQIRASQSSNYNAHQNKAPLPLVSYLWLRIRTELGIILLPWAVLTFVFDISAYFLDDTRFVEIYLPVIFLFFLVFCGPLLLRLLWKTHPLPAGDLKRRLHAFSERVNLKCSAVLVWNTKMQITNAAVIGMTRILRYVFITDALLHNCSDDEVEGIFAHEAGHIKGHHFLFYIFMIGAFIASNGVILNFFFDFAHSGDHLFEFEKNWSFLTPSFVLLLYAVLYWGIVFGAVSRRLEREADLYSLSNSSRPDAFISALNKLAFLSGKSIRAGGWRHFSIEERIVFMQNVLNDPRLKTKAQWKTRGIKIAIFLFLLFSVYLSTVVG